MKPWILKTKQTFLIIWSFSGFDLQVELAKLQTLTS